MITLFVVCPIRVHRDGLVSSLSAIDGFQVIGAAPTLMEARANLPEPRPSVTLFDSSDPGDNDTGIAAELPIVAVGVAEDAALAWVEAGVVGYLPPEASIQDVTVAVARVARGQALISTGVAKELSSRVRTLTPQTRHEPWDSRLTHREHEVLELLAEGLPNKVIGRRLSIQEQTVKNHVHKVLSKLGVHRRSEAAALARASAR